MEITSAERVGTLFTYDSMIRIGRGVFQNMKHVLGVVVFADSRGYFVDG